MKRLAATLALAVVLASCSDKNGTKTTDPGTKTSDPTVDKTDAAAITPRPSGTGEAIEPGAIAGGTTSEKGLVTMLRPLASNLAAGDPLRVAVHWQQGDEPINQSSPRRNVDRVATVASLRIHVTTPDGKRFELTADSTDVSGRNRYNYGLYYAPTLLLTLGAEGLYEAGEIGGPWKGDAPSFSAPGLYDVAISGTIVLADGGGITFDSEAVTIATGVTGVASTNELLEKATAIFESRVDNANAVKGYGATESGFAAGMVLELVKGERVVRFAQVPQGWSYQLYSVKLDAAGNELGFDEQSVGTCVAQGTAIATPNGSVAIETLQVGDEVWSWDLEAERRVTSTVREIRRGLRSDTMWIGSTLRVTPEHPVYANGTWQAAVDVERGASMMTLDGEVTSAPAAAAARGSVPVFDITVDGPHNFFAGGILVHNKDRTYWANLDDPWFFMWDPKRKN